MPYHTCCNGYTHRINCRHYVDTSRDNAGQLGVDIQSGDLTVGIGGGLAIDTQTGDLELQIAPGIDIDLGGGNDNWF